MRRYFFFILTIIIFLFSFRSLSYSFPSYTSLCSYLNNLEGWKVSECNGMNMNTGAGDMVSASKVYSNGNKTVNVGIIGGINALSYWAPFQAHFEINTPKEMVKMFNVNGSNIGITFNKKDNSGAIIVPIKKNANIVGIIMFEFSNMGWKEALEFSKKFNWKKIGSLF